MCIESQITNSLIAPTYCSPNCQMVLYLQLQLSALAFEPLLIAYEAKTTLHATFLIWRLYIYDSMFPNESTFWFSKCKVVYLHNVLP